MILFTAWVCEKLRRPFLQFRAECSGLWIGARLEVTFFFLQIVLFSQANVPVLGLVYMRLTQCADKKQSSLWQSKVASSLTLLQKPGHWAHNCKNSPFWFSVPDKSNDCYDNQVLSTNAMIVAGSLNFFATV